MERTVYPIRSQSMKERIIDPQFDPDREKKIFKMYVSIPEEEEERLTAKEKVGHLRFE